MVIEFNKNIDFFPTWPEMVDLIADVDAGLIALCKHATPSFWVVWWCLLTNWLKKRFWVLWHRVFPRALGSVWPVDPDRHRDPEGGINARPIDCGARSPGDRSG